MLWVEGVHVQWPWSWLEPIFMSVCLSRMKWCGGGGGTERENADVVFSVLFKARSIAKSWAIWDCHHPHDVKFNSCVAIMHLFIIMHCIYLTNWHQDFILVYFILKVSFTFLKIKPASYEKIKRRNPHAVLDPAMDEQPILTIWHRTVQLLEKWRS